MPEGTVNDFPSLKQPKPYMASQRLPQKKVMSVSVFGHDPWQTPGTHDVFKKEIREGV